MNGVPREEIPRHEGLDRAGKVCGKPADFYLRSLEACSSFSIKTKARKQDLGNEWRHCKIGTSIATCLAC
jgi:hypothetical protein